MQAAHSEMLSGAGAGGKRVEAGAGAEPDPRGTGAARSPRGSRAGFPRAVMLK